MFLFLNQKSKLLGINIVKDFWVCDFFLKINVQYLPIFSKKRRKYYLNILESRN